MVRELNSHFECVGYSELPMIWASAQHLPMDCHHAIGHSQVASMSHDMGSPPLRSHRQPNRCRHRTSQHASSRLPSTTPQLAPRSCPNLSTSAQNPHYNPDPKRDHSASFASSHYCQINAPELLDVDNRVVTRRYCSAYPIVSLALPHAGLSGGRRGYWFLAVYRKSGCRTLLTCWLLI